MMALYTNEGKGLFIDEAPLPHETVSDQVRRLALAKGRVVAADMTAGWVVSADTLLSPTVASVPRVATAPATSNVFLLTMYLASFA